MATQGPNFAGTGADDAGVGTSTWGNPQNIVSSNNLRASSPLSIGVTSHYLKATNFGFSIPTGATINGIEVTIEAQRGSGSDAHTTSAKFVKTGSVVGNELSAGNNWPSPEATFVIGGPTELGGQTWTPADINDSTFGFAISATNSVGATTSPAVDAIQITIYYTGGASGIPNKQVIQQQSVNRASFY